MESGGEGARVPPELTLYLERNPRLPAGKSKWNKSKYYTPPTTSIGRITFQKKQHIQRVSEEESVSVENFDLFKEVVPGIGVEFQDELRDLLISHQHSFSLKTSDLGHTDLVRHTIESIYTQGQGPIRQWAYRFSPYQRETAQEIIDNFSVIR